MLRRARREAPIAPIFFVSGGDATIWTEPLLNLWKYHKGDEMAPQTWRRRFIDLAQELRHEAGEPARDFQDAPRARIGMSIRRGGVNYELIHHPGDGDGEDRFLVCCELVSAQNPSLHGYLKSALSANQLLVRSRCGAIGVNPESGALVWNCFFSLRDASLATLTNAFASMSRVALQWRNA
jgi:hypothetical protein